MEKYILTSRGELLLSECDGRFRLPVAGEVGFRSVVRRIVSENT